jgi:hypothetical protein
VNGLRDPDTVVATGLLLPWSGRVWRFHHRSRNALNADGSLGGFGGRFNAGIESNVRSPFRALYASLESAAALLEVIRYLGYLGPDSRHVVALDGIVMCVLSQLDVRLQRVFDWSADSDLRDLLASNTIDQKLPTHTHSNLPQQPSLPELRRFWCRRQQGSTQTSSHLLTTSAKAATSKSSGRYPIFDRTERLF